MSTRSVVNAQRTNRETFRELVNRLRLAFDHRSPNVGSLDQSALCDLCLSILMLGHEVFGSSESVDGDGDLSTTVLHAIFDELCVEDEILFNYGLAPTDPYLGKLSELKQLFSRMGSDFPWTSTVHDADLLHMCADAHQSGMDWLRDHPCSVRDADAYTGEVDTYTSLPHPCKPDAATWEM